MDDDDDDTSSDSSSDNEKEEEKEDPKETYSDLSWDVVSVVDVSDDEDELNAEIVDAAKKHHHSNTESDDFSEYMRQIKKQQEISALSSTLLLLLPVSLTIPCILSEKHFFSLSEFDKASLDDIFDIGNFKTPILCDNILAFFILLLLNKI